MSDACMQIRQCFPVYTSVLAPITVHQIAVVSDCCLVIFLINLQNLKIGKLLSQCFYFWFRNYEKSNLVVYIFNIAFTKLSFRPVLSDFLPSTCYIFICVLFEKIKYSEKDKINSLIVHQIHQYYSNVAILTYS